MLNDENNEFTVTNKALPNEHQRNFKKVNIEICFNKTPHIMTNLMRVTQLFKAKLRHSTSNNYLHALQLPPEQIFFFASSLKEKKGKYKST